jgi:RNA polymerase sigma factor (sigma-70 family)
MPSGHLRTLLRSFPSLATPGAGGLTDEQLLERFVADRDEAAFEVLVWRHGPLVYNVCRRVLRRPDDVEDAFQATFLALVRRASAIRNRGAVGAWLYQVAHRAALRARAARRATEPYPEAEVPAPATEDALAWRDLRPLLDAEVHRLPAKYRDAVTLCYLSGHTTEEAARQLGCPRGTVLSRLAWARERLRKRLGQCGVALSSGVLAAWLAQEGAAASAPATLIDVTVRAATGLAWGKAAAAGVVSARAVLIMEGVLRSMLLTKLNTMVTVGVLTTVLGLGVGSWACRPATADPPDPRREDVGKPAVEPRASRVALLNLGYVLKNYDEYKGLQETVKKQMEEYQVREKASQERIADLRKLLETNLPAGKREDVEREVKNEVRRAEDVKEEAKRKLSKMTDEQTVMLYKKVHEVASRYAAAHDIDLVLHYNDALTTEEQLSPQNVMRKMQSGGCVPLYWKPELEISKAVVAAMNESYRSAAPARGK